MRGQADPDRDLDFETGLGEVQVATLRLVALTSLPLILGFLVLGMQDLHVRQRPEMWLVVLSMAATGLLTYRLAAIRPALAALVLVLGLLGTISVALAVYPGSQIIFSLALASMAAATFLGLPAYVVTSLLLSALVLVLTGQSPGPWTGIDPTAVLFLVWGGGAFSWLATRPTRIALDWAWSSYAQAREKTEALRDRQGELVQLTEALNRSCERLEEANRELDWARRDAEEARRLKSQFAATISHELRTPLNLVIGFAELIIRDLRTGPGALSIEHYRGDLEAIYRNACHVSNLVDDVLDLSQVDAHRLALQKQSISLASVIKDAADTLGLMFDEAGVGLQIDLPADLPEVWADPLRIRQVLINLLHNSLRHTDAGEVTVSAHRVDREVVISVSDTGLGISPEEIPRIFDEFQQVGDLSRRRGGSGLGLSVTRRFIEMHGGSIWVESRPDEGSTFHFSLPLQDQVVAAVPDRDWGKLLRPTAEGAARTILVVDRDPEPARLLNRYLHGYQSVCLASPADAPASHPPGHAPVFVVTGDPVLAGDNPALAEPAIPDDALAITCPVRTQRLIGKELGVAAYLVKPISLEALAATFGSVGDEPRTVLIVDDDRDMASLLARMVGQLFWRCQTFQAHDGLEALALLRSAQPDVVLLDLLMTGMDGHAVLAAMREEPTLRDIPVVIVTARDREEDTITVPAISIRRKGGLTIGEAVRCLQSCLDALLAPPPDTSGPARPGDLPVQPVWAGTPRPPASAPASSRA